eukprot:TRINITY_DN3768_c0_g2_i1.p1 TRINITY_DN3768_c0_g2~~TRINITY_DN3768_c0_g2_i1.p1  ORF type:complete len:781 (+),score=41.16 TRINITY_DN3768_c0_g2_i1:294-2636(+)
MRKGAEDGPSLSPSMKSRKGAEDGPSLSPSMKSRKGAEDGPSLSPSMKSWDGSSSSPLSTASPRAPRPVVRNRDARRGQLRALYDSPGGSPRTPERKPHPSSSAAAPGALHKARRGTFSVESKHSTLRAFLLEHAFDEAAWGGVELPTGQVAVEVKQREGDATADVPWVDLPWDEFYIEARATTHAGFVRVKQDEICLKGARLFSAMWNSMNIEGRVPPAIERRMAPVPYAVLLEDRAGTLALTLWDYEAQPEAAAEEIVAVCTSPGGDDVEKATVAAAGKAPRVAVGVAEKLWVYDVHAQMPRDGSKGGVSHRLVSTRILAALSILSVALNANGTEVFVVVHSAESAALAVHVYDAVVGDAVQALPLRCSGTSHEFHVAVSPRNTRFAVVGPEGTALFRHDGGAWAEDDTPMLGGPSRFAYFSPDGLTFVAVADDGTATSTCMVTQTSVRSTEDVREMEWPSPGTPRACLPHPLVPSFIDSGAPARVLAIRRGGAAEASGSVVELYEQERQEPLLHSSTSVRGAVLLPVREVEYQYIMPSSVRDTASHKLSFTSGVSLGIKVPAGGGAGLPQELIMTDDIRRLLVIAEEELGLQPMVGRFGAFLAELRVRHTGGEWWKDGNRQYVSIETSLERVMAKHSFAQRFAAYNGFSPGLTQAFAKALASPTPRHSDVVEALVRSFCEGQRRAPAGDGESQDQDCGALAKFLAGELCSAAKRASTFSFTCGCDEEARLRYDEATKAIEARIARAVSEGPKGRTAADMHAEMMNIASSYSAATLIS